MKPSLESLLHDSLNNLRDLNATPQASADHGPVEDLNLMTADQIREDVIAHTVEESAEIENGNYESMIPDLIEQNAAEHLRMREDIAEVRNMVSSVIQSMEMLTCVTSMESIDEGSVQIANTAMGNIAVLTGQDNIPSFVVEDGKLTTTSMESIVDFITDTLRKMKRWIKEKYDNFVISYRRGIRTDQTTRARITALSRRLDSIDPNEHGIPAKQLRYAPEMIGYLYRDGKPIELTQESLSSALKEALEYTSFANKNIATDAVKRSLHLSDNIGKVLMAPDAIEAEKLLKDMFKEVVGKYPAESFLNYGKEIIGGITYLDPHVVAPRPSRDVEWIAALADNMNLPVGHHRLRKSGTFSSKANTLAELKLALDYVVEAIESEAYNDDSWYNEIAGAWNAAARMHDRMIVMVQSVHLPHLNNELWRALDVACTAMFLYAERSYYQTLYVRAPSFRFIQGLLYLCEEQGKAYAAVNR